MKPPRKINPRLRWRGKDYANREELAAAAGCDPSNITHHLARNGNMDRLGEGSDHLKRHHPHATPVNINGQEFPSVRALARAMGKRLTTTQRWLGKKQFDKIEAALAAQKESET